MDNRAKTTDNERSYLELNFFNVIRQLAFRFNEDDVTALAAQMTYYMILSVFPFLILLLSILAQTGLSSSEVLENIAQAMPEESSAVIIGVINETVSASTTGLMSVSMLAALWTASNGVGALMKGINKAYDIHVRRPFLIMKGIAIIFTVGLIGMIILVMVLLVMGEVIGHRIFSYFDAASTFSLLWNILRYMVPLVGLTAAFMLFYHFAPSRKAERIHSFGGALFATIGWLFLSQLFSNYVNQFGNYARVYGSIGGIIVFLIWLYISSIIILTGGELNASIAYLKSDDRIEKYEKVPYILPFTEKRRRHINR